MIVARPGALALAALGGASAWCSLGSLALVDSAGNRLGALPSVWWLPALVAIALLVVWRLGLRTSEALPLSLTAVVWGPWLPMRVPAALLIWDGPLEYLLWTSVMAAVVVAWGHRRYATRPRLLAIVEALRDPRCAPWIAALLFFVTSTTTSVALQGYLPGGDEPHYLVITQSLLRDGDLAIENNHTRGDYFEYVDDPMRPDFLQRGRDGEIYSVHAPGVSALVLPAFAAAGYPGAVLCMVVLSAFGVMLMWRAAFESTGQAGAAWVATLSTACGATYFLQSFTIFPDPAGAVLVSLALLCLVRLINERASHATLVMAGAALAGLPWLHTRFALVAAGFGAIFVWLIWRGRAQRAPGSLSALVAFAAIPTASALAWFGFFVWIYGTPNPAAPYGSGRQSAVEWLPTGLTGLLFDQQFGLLSSTPALALVALGLPRVWHRHRPLAAASVAVVVPYVAVVASFGMWWGGWSAPARFLTCLIPLGVVPIAVVWSTSGAGTRALVVGTIIVGIVNVAARIGFEGGALVYNFRDGYDLLLDWASRTVNLPLAFPSVHRLTLLDTLAVSAVWLLALLLAALVVRLSIPTRVQSVGARTAAVMWVLLLSSAFALTAGWEMARVQPMTPESSKISFIQDWRPAWRSLAVTVPTFQVVETATAIQQLTLHSSTRPRELGDGRALLTLPRLPAGEYRVTVAGDHERQGMLSLSVGATSQVIERWPLSRPPTSDQRFTLPTQVHSVSIREDQPRHTYPFRVALQPLTLDTGRNAARFALRAARYGISRVFFLDDGLYMEPEGVWSRGDSRAEFVLDPDHAESVLMRVLAGPVPASVELTSAEASQRVELGAGEARELRLARGAWTIRTRGRFRPKDYDPASTDARSLGVRLEFR